MSTFETISLILTALFSLSSIILVLINSQKDKQFQIKSNLFNVIVIDRLNEILSFINHLHKLVMSKDLNTAFQNNDKGYILLLYDDIQKRCENFISDYVFTLHLYSSKLPEEIETLLDNFQTNLILLIANYSKQNQNEIKFFYIEYSQIREEFLKSLRELLKSFAPSAKTYK